MKDHHQLIERFGIYFSEIGLSKTYGRLFGVFMTASTPLSMGDLVDRLKISKSTASTELRRLLTMGVIEKAPTPEKRADHYQLKQNIWSHNLRQKISDIQTLSEMIEEVPSNTLSNLPHLQEMAHYCTFMEEELAKLMVRYEHSLTKGSKQ